MIFRFTMLSDENDNFVREYEVVYDMSLLDFHLFLCRDLGYDPGQMVSFFTADNRWEKTREFTLFDVGPQDEGLGLPTAPMESTSLGAIIHQNHDRLVYMFDMLGDRSLYLELMETRKQEQGEEYPRCAITEGAPPDQFDPLAGEDSGSGSIFDDIMADFNDFEGDDDYDDE